MRPSSPPRAALISVGDGPLLADAATINSAEIGRLLDRAGVPLLRAVSVPGDATAIALALGEVEADLCVVVGGFGPGTDNGASAAVARVVGAGQVRDLEAEARVHEGRGRGEAHPEGRRWRADLPAGATLVVDPILGLPGFVVAGDARLVIVLPDAPAALRSLVTAELAPRVAARWPGLGPRSRAYRVLGPAIAAARELTAAALAGAAGGEAVRASIAAHGPELVIRLCAGPGDAAALAALDGPMLAAFGPALHGIGEADLPTRLCAALIARGLRIASAESCTGGRVAALITGVAGASACIHGSIVAYDNAVKKRALGVPAALLREYGAVSEPVARAMAAGVRRAFPGHVDIGVGITGIAGPGGGSAAKPVGTVDFAVDDAEGSRHRRIHLTGDRPAIQEAAAIWALRLVWDRLRERGLCGPALLD